MINIDESIRAKLTGLQLAIISCTIKNSAYEQDLWQQIESICKHIQSTEDFEQIKNQSNIKACKEAYRQLGKDPNRYRPSAEALRRRIVKGNPLYQISTVVDIINLVSLQTGYSIGGFDQDKVTGKITLGIGLPDEPYEGIGRGQLNIENLPVYRDDKGGIGTPTSDNLRTSISLETSRLLIVINDFAGNKTDLDQGVDLACEYLSEFASGSDFEIHFVS